MSSSCAVSACNDGWADCDGSAANGCERNVDPPSMGGLGPCLPDAGCTQFSYDGRDYSFCPNGRTWSDARSRCQLQLLGDLVHVNDAAEEAFVRSHLVEPAVFENEAGFKQAAERLQSAVTKLASSAKDENAFKAAAGDVAKPAAPVTTTSARSNRGVRLQKKPRLGAAFLFPVVIRRCYFHL